MTVTCNRCGAKFESFYPNARWCSAKCCHAHEADKYGGEATSWEPPAQPTPRAPTRKPEPRPHPPSPRAIGAGSEAWNAFWDSIARWRREAAEKRRARQPEREAAEVAADRLAGRVDAPEEGTGS